MLGNTEIGPPRTGNEVPINLKMIRLASSPEAFVHPFIRINLGDILVETLECHVCGKGLFFILINDKSSEWKEHVPEFAKGGALSQLLGVEVD